MRERLNCPNCGAPITGATCEYCGTVFYDFANIELFKEGYLRMKIENNLNIFKAVPTNIKVENTAEEITLYADNAPYVNIAKPEYLVTIQLQVVPDDRGVLVERHRNKKEVKQ